MLEKILHIILHQKVLIVLAAIMLLGAGIIAWHRLPIDAFPDATNQQVMILTEAPGLAAVDDEEVEEPAVFGDAGGGAGMPVAA